MFGCCAGVANEPRDMPLHSVFYIHTELQGDTESLILQPWPLPSRPRQTSQGTVYFLRAAAAALRAASSDAEIWTLPGVTPLLFLVTSLNSMRDCRQNDCVRQMQDSAHETESNARHETENYVYVCNIEYGLNVNSSDSPGRTKGCPRTSPSSRPGPRGACQGGSHRRLGWWAHKKSVSRQLALDVQ